MIHQHIFASPKPGMSEAEFQDYWLHVHAVNYASRIDQTQTLQDRHPHRLARAWHRNSALPLRCARGPHPDRHAAPDALDDQTIHRAAGQRGNGPHVWQSAFSARDWSRDGFR